VRELRAASDVQAVSVYDMPLLVERRLWPHEHLSVVVGADTETRVRRLVDQRGLDEADARHRIARQATDEERRAAADVWVDNDGAVEATRDQVRALWFDRLVPFNANLLTGNRSRLQRGVVVDPDPAWPAQAARLSARVADALGDRAVRVEHIGSTSVPDLPAKDAIDLQVGVRTLTDAVWRRFPETPPYGGVHDDVIPHVTVGHNRPLSALRAAADEISTHLPIPAVVGQVLLMAGSNAPNSWRTLHELSLHPVLM